MSDAKREKRIARPSTRGEALRQVEATYKFNDWKDAEQARNALLVGLEVKSVGEYSEDYPGRFRAAFDDFV